ncbi:hypothetical protein [Synechococcus sp. PCC 6312]|uniref:hypothetical protein n=1 Tax=Synechococcus sp. (strain ATCC 27167 / PCC 6312) TaxID=195253 RepID=UPI00029F4CB8|nr:hypothetical protein [Synechococcus sp. PCC 6312]AFY59567.1 hypothetical protein Syn6312_0333 [Synechococcus sp. PCC 6312]
MELEFIPVDEFYFAITLAMRTLAEFGDQQLVSAVHQQLQTRFGQASTVASGHQNTFNYVFRVHNYDNSPADQLIVSIADWHDKIRLSTDYGWTLDDHRKPIRSDKFSQRQAFSPILKSHLQAWLDLPTTFLEGSPEHG